MIIEGLLVGKFTVYRPPPSCGISNQLVKILTHFPLYVPFKMYHLLGIFTTDMLSEWGVRALLTTLW